MENNKYRGNTVQLHIPGAPYGDYSGSGCNCNDASTGGYRSPHSHSHGHGSSSGSSSHHGHAPSHPHGHGQPHQHGHGGPPRPPHPHGGHGMQPGPPHFHGHGGFGPGPFFPFFPPVAPLPLPLPIPVPIPGPAPYPPVPYPPATPSFVTVVINGGHAFPGITNGYTVPYRNGMSIADALAATGAVRFTPAGQIASVGGIPVAGGFSYQIRLNGRILPASLLGTPIQPTDTVSLELVSV